MTFLMVLLMFLLKTVGLVGTGACLAVGFYIGNKLTANVEAGLALA